MHLDMVLLGLPAQQTQGFVQGGIDIHQFRRFGRRGTQLE